MTGAARIALRLAIGLPLAVVLLGGLALWHFAPRPSPAETVDYQAPSSWLCRPGRADACAADLSATAIAADGTTKLLPSPPPADAPIDCFYVYPTVSSDPHENAPLAETAAEHEVAVRQFARFRSICRTYAPLYRQVTLRSLAYDAVKLGQYGSFGLAFADVRAAWRDYLAHDNQGRGVILIGHSQGSRMIKQLLAEEIENTPAQSRLILALLAGNSLRLPAGQLTGGDLKSLKLCTAPGQFGCVIAYSTFRASAPPLLDLARAGQPGYYGIDPGDGLVLGCANPAALAGGTAMLDAYLPARLATPRSPWTSPPVAVDTPFVTVPGLVSGQCVHHDGLTYLAVSFNSAPGDRRRGDINGDIKILGKVQKNWGLHLLDVNLVQGNLITAAQAAALNYVAARGAGSAPASDLH